MLVLDTNGLVVAKILVAVFYACPRALWQALRSFGASVCEN